MALDVMAPFEYHPRMPRWQDIDPAQVIFDYDGASDTLMILFYGWGRSAVNVLLDDFVSLRVDPETNEVIGVEIEDFLGHVARETPQWLDLAPLAGIEATLIEDVRRGIPTDVLKRAAMQVLAGQVKQTAG